MAYRHPTETTGRRPPATPPPRPPPARSSPHARPPPRTADDARADPPADDPANASPAAPSAVTPTRSACPSQPSFIERCDDQLNPPSTPVTTVTTRPTVAPWRAQARITR